MSNNEILPGQIRLWHDTVIIPIFSFERGMHTHIVLDVPGISTIPEENSRRKEEKTYWYCFAVYPENYKNKRNKKILGENDIKNFSSILQIT